MLSEVKQNHIKVLSRWIGLLIFLFLSLQGYVKADSSSFHDLEGHWARDAVEELHLKGILAGYPDGTFRPDDTISRAQLVTALTKIYPVTKVKAMSYNDVQEGEWYYDAVLQANASGYITGYKDGSFQPNRVITRQELAVILQSILKLPESRSYIHYADAEHLPTWSRGAVGAVTNQGLMTGYTDNTFQPYREMTRGEAAAVLLKFSQHKVSYIPGTLSREDGSVFASANLRIEGLHSVIPYEFSVVNGKFGLDLQDGEYRVWAIEDYSTDQVRTISYNNVFEVKGGFNSR
jgi:hypothetical protein